MEEGGWKTQVQRIPGLTGSTVYEITYFQISLALNISQLQMLDSTV